MTAPIRFNICSKCRVISSIHALGAWVGLKADLDVLQKGKAFCHCQKLELSPRPPSSEPSQCNDYDILVPSFLSVLLPRSCQFLRAEERNLTDGLVK
jgi:hypothetical protein